MSPHRLSDTEILLKRLIRKWAVYPALALLLLLMVPLLVRQFDELDSDLQRQTRGVAQVLARQAGFAVYAQDQWLMQRLLRAVVDTEPTIVAAGFYTQEGQVLALEKNGGQRTEPVWTPKQEEPHAVPFPGGFLWALKVDADPLQVEDTYTKRSDAREVWVLLQVSNASLQHEKYRLISFVVLVALIAFALAMWLARRMADQLSQPLLAVHQTVRELTAGQLTSRIDPRASGPLDELMHGINALADRVSVTEQNLLMRIEKATAALNDRTLRAERAEQDKSRLLAAASHDLRTPVYAMRLMCADLLTGTWPPFEQERLRRLDLALLNQERMLDALLNIGRYEAGQVVPSPSRVDLLSLLIELGDELSSVADVAGLSLRVRGHAIALDIDPSLLRRIVVNLLDNALHYTTQGGVLLSCRQRISRQEVWVQIWDTGQGIDAQHIESIFEAYTRQDGAKLNPSGVGLGLALCWRFSQAMGLSLTATSRPGRGSVFTLKIPIAHVATD